MALSAKKLDGSSKSGLGADLYFIFLLGCSYVLLISGILVKRSRTAFVVPGRIILFDVTASELKSPKGPGFDKYTFCSNFRNLEAPDFNRCFLSAKCNKIGTWQFGFSELKRGIGPISVRFRFIGFEKQEFLGLTDYGIVDSPQFA